MSYLIDIMAIAIPIIFWIIFFSIIVSLKKNASNQKKAPPVYTIPSKAAINPQQGSHQRQVDYSQAYSIKNTTKDSGIHDAPLTEAEKNVLYGK